MIKSITIRDFKSLKNVTVELGPVTVLVGRSGTGKSNVVSSLRCLRDFLHTGRIEEAARTQVHKIAPEGQRDFCVHFDLTFNIEGIEGDFRYILSHPFGQTNETLSESLSLGAKTFFSHKGRKWVVPPDMVPRPNVDGIMLGKLPALSETVIAFSALTNGIGCYEFPLGVLTGSQRAPYQLDGLSDGAENFLHVLQRITLNIRNLSLRKRILAALMTVNPTVVAIELDSPQAPQRVKVTHDFNGNRIALDLDQESEGFRRFFAHLLALYQESTKQLMLFEHPEDAIYPGALQLLAEELKEAPVEKRGQVVITTHNPWFLSNFDPELLRVVTLQKGQTHIGRVAPEQIEAVHDGLMSTGELLTADPARLATAGTSSV